MELACWIKSLAGARARLSGSGTSAWGHSSDFVFFVAGLFDCWDCCYWFMGGDWDCIGEDSSGLLLTAAAVFWFSVALSDGNWDSSNADSLLMYLWSSSIEWISGAPISEFVRVRKHSFWFDCIGGMDS